jgi:hypothetical protein
MLRRLLLNAASHPVLMSLAVMIVLGPMDGCPLG